MFLRCWPRAVEGVVASIRCDGHDRSERSSGSLLKRHPWKFAARIASTAQE